MCNDKIEDGPVQDCLVKDRSRSQGSGQMLQVHENKCGEIEEVVRFCYLGIVIANDGGALPLQACLVPGICPFSHENPSSESSAQTFCPCCYMAAKLGW